MARTPKAKNHPIPEEPPSRLARVIDNIIRHKLKWIFATVIGLGSSGMVAAYQMIEPGIPAFHYWVRDLVIEDHTYIIYLKLRDARQALKDAKDELIKNPNSGTAQRSFDYYTDIIAKYQKQLDRAAGN